ncbi:MAG: hypothetical protein ABI624_18350 [Casimicrobiaceae bacterium]
MVKLEWKVNGRTVSSDRVADELGKAIRTEAIEKVKQAVARVRCPVHGSGASHIRVSGSGSRLQFHYEACCDGLKQAIAAKLR